MTLRQTLTHNLLNIPGWRTNRHIVVIESDDWGSIRMPSREVYEKLLKEGYQVDKHPYEKYDSLATESDLSALFDILQKHKDKNGHHPIITANCVVANPDFERIKADNYSNYYFEPFTETLMRYTGCEKSFEMWKQGMEYGIFKPQFHGREHLNVARWMKALQDGDTDNLHVFDYGMMGIFPKNNHTMGNVFQVALDDSKYKSQPISDIISEGLDMFENIFGYKSLSFIAPCYTWNPKLDETLYDKGVIGLQGTVYQRNPGEKHIRHWMGNRNSFGQIYTIRNCSFEPTQMNNKDMAISECLYRIKCAFRWNKPAIISAHRINFIGSIREENRIENLKQFDILLSEIIKQWPDIEFMSSDGLIQEIRNN